MGRWKHHKSGITLVRDFYAEHFAGPDEIKTNYMIQYFGDTLDEDECPKKLAVRCRRMAKRLERIASYLEKREP